MFISKRGKFEVRGARNVVLDVKLDGDPKARFRKTSKIGSIASSRAKQPNANMEVAVRTATAVHLGNIATRLQRTVHFDPDSRRLSATRKPAR